MIVFVMIQFTQRILTVTHTSYRPRKSNTIFFIYGNNRCHFQRIFHRSAISLACISQCEVFTDSDVFVYIVH